MAPNRYHPAPSFRILHLLWLRGPNVLSRQINSPVGIRSTQDCNELSGPLDAISLLPIKPTLQPQLIPPCASRKRVKSPTGYSSGCACSTVLLPFASFPIFAALRRRIVGPRAPPARQDKPGRSSPTPQPLPNTYQVPSNPARLSNTDDRTIQAACDSLRRFNVPNGMNLPQSRGERCSVLVATQAFAAPMVAIKERVSSDSNRNRMRQIPRRSRFEDIASREH